MRLMSGPSRRVAVEGRCTVRNGGGGALIPSKARVEARGDSRRGAGLHSRGNKKARLHEKVLTPPLAHLRCGRHHRLLAMYVVCVGGKGGWWR